MRLMSVDAIKHGRPHTQHPVPKEGSQLRRIHDLLRATPAYPVNLSGIYASSGKLYLALGKLKTWYCMDIRSFPDKSRGQGNHRNYMLVGEWVGKDYVDYVAQRVEKEGL